MDENKQLKKIEKLFEMISEEYSNSLKNSFYGIFSTYSGVGSLIIYSKLVTPFQQRFSYIVNSYKMVTPSIQRLFFTSNPPTILLRIIPIIIYSINLSIFFPKFIYMSLVRFIHIISKTLKTFPKTFNVATSISAICMVISVCASLFKVSKNCIKSVMIKTVSISHNILTRKGDTLSRMSPLLVLS